MNSDKVSVLMTVYNTAAYLDRSITSIINQTYKNFELIIIDDGSQDGSKKWSGRGRTPSWVVEICRSKGISVEGFKSDSRFVIELGIQILAIGLRI